MTQERLRAFGGPVPVAVYLLKREAGELRLAAATEGTEPPDGLSSWYSLSARSPVVDAFQAGRPVWPDAAALAAYGETGAAAAAAGVALGALALGPAGGRWGALVAVDESGEGFGADRRGFLELYADHIAERLAAEGRAEVRPEVLRHAMERHRLGTFALTLTTGLVEADTTALKLLGMVEGEFDGRVESLFGRTVPDDLPALMSIVEPTPRTAGSRELEFRIRGASGEPRWLRLRCLTRAGPDGRPRRVLGVLADASRLRPGADEVSRVQRLSAALATAVTVRDVGHVTAAALRELGAERVVLAETESDRLVVTALDPPELDAWPEAWRAAWPEVPVRDLPTLQAALRERRTELWPLGSGLEPGLGAVGPGGLAVLPLPADGQVAGACLVGWAEPHEFDTEERFLLTAAAGLVGQALGRARAFDAQHELAATLQRSLLPRALPALPGGVAVARYLPATVGLDVGGDWYDVIPLTDRHVALVIGDVQGHSAAAATIMGQIRTAIRAYAVEGHSPDVVISHANRLLVGMETDLFATCCYVAMDMEEGDTWLVRAGHLPPLVRDPDGGTREVTVEGGPPLGILMDAEFPLTTLGLSPGTVLTLLTDGLVESASLPLEDGMRRVRDLLAAGDLSDAGRLADTLLGGAGRRDDDVALLLLRYDGMRVRPRRAGWEVWRLPNAVGHARRFVGRTLRSWSVADGADMALLIVSELVTNALVHTQGPVRLDLTLTGDRLRVAVSDSSPRAPQKSAGVDWEATGGRGILLVEAVSSAWGSVPLSGGKQVWGEINVMVAEPDEAGNANVASIT
ncbi:SpoIIE family protein phosphatase [Streptomyces litchfieldiae]|uniref:SpoIIE family protein phosphatase n=1 Tax=Streptomyces litchfieldiae TaxID=3075543 RepID=A0ABU2MMD5_9ACTN|nr:SpoIIE family protein phosphatase [Streptomyces sp. DSM 44938]MDT0342768.1 SpoIIE family protein phosphatase [Streptomyces sp. DSM 44938]